MQQESLNPDSAGARVDLLTLAFKAACQRRQIEAASSLLTEIDGALLGEPMGSKERANALMRVRAFRNDLERLRAENPLPQPAHHDTSETVAA